jgi:hypothetical protein
MPPTRRGSNRSSSAPVISFPAIPARPPSPASQAASALDRPAPVRIGIWCTIRPIVRTIMISEAILICQSARLRTA